MSLSPSAITPTPYDPSVAGAKITENANKVSASDDPCTILGRTVRDGTDRIGTLLTDASAVKKRSVASGFFGKCRQCFAKIGQFLGLTVSNETRTAQAIKRETETLLRYVTRNPDDLLFQAPNAKMFFKETGGILNDCEARINDLKAKRKATNDVGCKLYLNGAISDLAKVAAEVHGLSLQMSEALIRQNTPTQPDFPNASIPTSGEKGVLLNTNEIWAEQPSDTVIADKNADIPQRPNPKTIPGRQPQVSFETVRSAFAETAKTVAEEPENNRRNPKTAEDAPQSRPDPEKPPRETTVNAFQRSESRHKDEAVKMPEQPVPQPSVRNRTTHQTFRQRNNRFGKTVQPQAEPPKRSVREKMRDYQKNTVTDRNKHMKMKDRNAPKNEWFNGKKVQTDASGNKVITHNTKLGKNRNLHEKF